MRNPWLWLSGVCALVLVGTVVHSTFFAPEPEPQLVGASTNVTKYLTEEPPHLGSPPNALVKKVVPPPPLAPPQWFENFEVSPPPPPPPPPLTVTTLPKPPTVPDALKFESLPEVTHSNPSDGLAGLPRSRQKAAEGQLKIAKLKLAEYEETVAEYETYRKQLEQKLADCGKPDPSVPALVEANAKLKTEASEARQRLAQKAYDCEQEKWKLSTTLTETENQKRDLEAKVTKLEWEVRAAETTLKFRDEQIANLKIELAKAATPPTPQKPTRSLEDLIKPFSTILSSLGCLVGIVLGVRKERRDSRSPR